MLYDWLRDIEFAQPYQFILLGLAPMLIWMYLYDLPAKAGSSYSFHHGYLTHQLQPGRQLFAISLLRFVFWLSSSS